MKLHLRQPIDWQFDECQWCKSDHTLSAVSCKLEKKSRFVCSWITFDLMLLSHFGEFDCYSTANWTFFSFQSPRSLSAFAVESPTSKDFSTGSKIFQFAAQSSWIRSAFATKLTETALRTHRDCSTILANAQRLRCESYQLQRKWRSWIFCNKFYLRNNEWWKGNGKINNCLNVSY